MPPALGVDLQNEIIGHPEAVGIREEQDLRTLSITPDYEGTLIIVNAKEDYFPVLQGDEGKQGVSRILINTGQQAKETELLPNHQTPDQYSMASGQLPTRFHALQSNCPICNRTYKKKIIMTHLLIYHQLIKLFEIDKEDYVTCKNSGCKMTRVLFSSKMPLHFIHHTLISCPKADAAGFLAELTFRHVRTTDLLHGLTKGKDSSELSNTGTVLVDHQ